MGFEKSNCNISSSFSYSNELRKHSAAAITYTINVIRCEDSVLPGTDYQVSISD